MIKKTYRQYQFARVPNTKFWNCQHRKIMINEQNISSKDLLVSGKAVRAIDYLPT